MLNSRECDLSLYLNMDLKRRTIFKLEILIKVGRGGVQTFFLSLYNSFITVLCFSKNLDTDLIHSGSVSSFFLTSIKEEGSYT